MKPRRLPPRGVPSAVRPLVCLVALAALASSARAAADGDAAVAVLGFEALDGAPDTIATEITDALRQRVAATKGYQLVQGKDLVEVKLVFACPDEAPACMSQAGKSMGATKVIFGNVKRAGTDYQVTLKLLDVGKAAVETWATEAVPRRRAEPAAFRSLAPVWIAKLAGRNAGGSLQIRANVQGAAVSLDGTRVGVTADKPVVITDVSPGRHEVAVEKEGYTTTKQEFSLAAGQSLPLRLALSPLSEDVTTAPPPEDTPPVLVRKPREAPAPEGGGQQSHTFARTAFWVAVVMTAASAAVGLKYMRDVDQINSDLDKYRRIDAGKPGCSAPSGQCYLNGDPAPARTQADVNNINSLTSSGQSAERWQFTAFAVGAGFAIAGGYFLYRGYLAGSGEESATASRGLRIFPTAGASAGGIVTEFDF
jgi:TolB-like protein